MRFSNIFQLYAIVACSAQVLALGTTGEQQGAAVVQRDVVAGSAGGAQDQPLERRAPSPVSRSGGRNPTTSGDDVFFDAEPRTARQKAAQRLAQIQQNNPQRTGFKPRPRPNRAKAAQKLNFLLDFNKQNTAGVPERTNLRDADDRLARLQAANPQRPTLTRSGRIRRPF
ncbi:hypothetical protein PspLS_09305 [Pyricularia sp. CBS 133598]|nr:hypothetical protein PspLS_09305 [Pyricularia sp. CBS 133598]